MVHLAAPTLVKGKSILIFHSIKNSLFKAGRYKEAKGLSAAIASNTKHEQLFENITRFFEWFAADGYCL